MHPAVARAAAVIAVLRYAVPVVAIPFIPALIPERVTLLVFLRPTKEFLLLAGFQVREGRIDWPEVALAYTPLMIVAVWAFFIVGRAYGDRLAAGEVPGWLARAIPPERLAQAQDLLERKGPTLAVLGRIAALPPTIMAAAAGSSEVDARRYLVADLVGAVLGFAVTLGAGYALGEAYERAGPWIAGAGLLLLGGLLYLATRWLRDPDEVLTDGDAPDPAPTDDQP